MESILQAIAARASDAPDRLAKCTQGGAMNYGECVQKARRLNPEFRYEICVGSASSRNVARTRKKMAKDYLAIWRSGVAGASTPALNDRSTFCLFSIRSQRMT